MPSTDCPSWGLQTWVCVFSVSNLWFVYSALRYLSAVYSGKTCKQVQACPRHLKHNVVWELCAADLLKHISNCYFQTHRLDRSSSGSETCIRQFAIFVMLLPAGCVSSDPLCSLTHCGKCHVEGWCGAWGDCPDTERSAVWHQSSVLKSTMLKKGLHTALSEIGGCVTLSVWCTKINR